MCELGCTRRLARQRVSKHRCFDEHDELHLALTSERRWSRKTWRTATHRPSCRYGRQTHKCIYRTDDQVRLDESKASRQHQRPGHGKLVDRNEGAYRNCCRKQDAAQHSANEVVESQTCDAF